MTAAAIYGWAQAIFELITWNAPGTDVAEISYKNKDGYQNGRFMTSGHIGVGNSGKNVAHNAR